MEEALHKQKCFPEILSMYEDLIAVRHDIHSHPDCGFETGRTIAKIKEFLSAHGVAQTDMDEVSVPSSLIVTITGSRPGAAVALRADIDALKMTDEGKNPWASEIKGHAHACGHDGHLTWLLGACAYLAAHRDFAGSVVAIFQANEENCLGAKTVADSGILQKKKVREIIGAHDEAFLAKGKFGFRSGFIQAASDSFHVVFKGRGAHGGRPHLGCDPQPALVELYQAIQSIVTRKINALESAVISVCYLNAGMPGTYNVVPAEAGLGGTVRTFKPEVRDLIEETVRRFARGIAEAHGLEYEMKYDRLVEAVSNDEKLTEACRKTAEEFAGADSVCEIGPYMSSEDFCFYQKLMPGTIFGIGINDSNHNVPLHHPAFDFNDAVLPAASTLFVKLALTRLKALNKE